MRLKTHVSSKIRHIVLLALPFHVVSSIIRTLHYSTVMEIVLCWIGLGVCAQIQNVCVGLGFQAQVEICLVQKVKCVCP